MALTSRSGRIWKALHPDGECPVSDADLLTRFSDARDEAAFAELFARHGRLVYGVCRRVLADRHRAEDAYQAVWLVLARRATAVRPDGRLPAWLHGVAYRTALKLKTTDARRRRRELAVVAPEPSPPPDADLRSAIDAELAALPERLRLPVLLCDLGGHPQREAARRLGLPTATLANRLKAARDRLAVRLTARGLAPVLAAGLVESPPPLTATEPAARLAEQVLTGLALAKWKAAAVVLALAVGVALIGRAGGVSPLSQLAPTTSRVADEHPPGVPAQGADAPRSPEQTFLVRIIHDLRGDTPTEIERNYYAADRPPLRDGRLAGWLADDPAVTAHIRARFGPDARLRRESHPTTLGPARFCFHVVATGVGGNRVERLHRFAWTFADPPTPAYVIEPPDVLRIEAVQTDPGSGKDVRTPLPGQPISGEYHVRPDGTVGLGVWGNVKVTRLTLAMAADAIRDHLAAQPGAGANRFWKDRLSVTVDVKAFNSKFYYIISESDVESVFRFPCTGGETVLDAVTQVKEAVTPGSRMYVRRGEQVLPIDWAGITRHGQTATNYQLLPGDRLYIQAAKPPPAVVADEARRRVDRSELEKLEAQLAEARQRSIDPNAPVVRRLEAQVKNERAALDRRLEEVLRSPPVFRHPESDAAFLRRLLLDAHGTPPTGLELKYFEADPDPDKRMKVSRWLGTLPKPPARQTARERYTLLPPDSINITVRPVPGQPPPTARLDGNYYANSPLQLDGTVNPGWGGMNPAAVSGLTVDQAAEAIRRAVKNPADADRIRVEVRVNGYNNHRGFELIQDGPDGRPVTRKIAYRGETLFKQLTRDADGPADYDGQRIWIDRGGRLLPVDWDAITRRRDEATNHVIEPGDRVYVSGGK